MLSFTTRAKIQLVGGIGLQKKTCCGSNISIDRRVNLEIRYYSTTENLVEGKKKNYQRAYYRQSIGGRHSTARKELIPVSH
jgi:hypothetical protein